MKNGFYWLSAKKYQGIKPWFSALKEEHDQGKFQRLILLDPSFSTLKSSHQYFCGKMRVQWYNVEPVTTVPHLHKFCQEHKIPSQISPNRLLQIYPNLSKLLSSLSPTNPPKELLHHWASHHGHSQPASSNKDKEKDTEKFYTKIKDAVSQARFG